MSEFLDFSGLEFLFREEKEPLVTVNLSHGQITSKRGGRQSLGFAARPILELFNKPNVRRKILNKKVTIRVQTTRGTEVDEKGNKKEPQWFDVSTMPNVNSEYGDLGLLEEKMATLILDTRNNNELNKVNFERNKTYKVSVDVPPFISNTWYNSAVTLMNGSLRKFWSVLMDDEYGQPLGNIFNWIGGGAESKFEKWPVRVVIEERPDIIADFKEQKAIAEGSKHCLFHPIYRWSMRMSKEEKKLIDEKYHRRQYNKFKSMRRQTKKYIKKFKDGVPEDQLDEIAAKLGIKIEILDVFQNAYRTFNKANKSHGKTLKFWNTKFNHVDQFLINNDPIEKSQDELVSMMKRLDEKKTFYTYGRYKDNITFIKTKNNHYSPVRGFDFGPFEVAQKISDLKLRHKANTKLTDFIRESCIYHGAKTIRLASDVSTASNSSSALGKLKNRQHSGAGEFAKQSTEDKTVRHIDHVMSYAQFENCDYYQEFPKISTFAQFPRKWDTKKRVEFIRKTCGIYYVKKLSSKNMKPNAKKHFEQLGMTWDNGQIIAPGPLLNFWHDLGITFEPVCGAYGESKHIDISDLKKKVMINGRNTGLYSVWTGMKKLVRLFDNVMFSQYDENMVGILKARYPDKFKVVVNPWRVGSGTASGISPGANYEKTPILQIARKEPYHLIHIHSFILAYSQISVVQQILKFKPEQVCRVITDGIFYTGPTPEIMPNFIEKKAVMTSNDSTCFIGEQQTKWYRCLIPKALMTEYKRVMVISAPGGHGKTEHAMTKMGLVDPAYVAISSLLVNSKMEKYGCLGANKARLMGEGCDETFRNTKPGAIVLDEATMYQKQSMENIIGKFPNSRFIILGDWIYRKKGIAYQMPPFVAGGKDEITYWNWWDYARVPVRLNKNYRTTECKELTNKLVEMRKEMAKIISIPKGKNKEEKLSETYKQINTTRDVMMKIFSGRIVDESVVADLYTSKDMIIASTHKSVDYWTKKMDDLKRPKKWLVEKNSKDNFNGTVLIQPEQPKNSVLRHCFTAHQLVGLDAEHKIFIDASNMFVPQMYYIAVSRAKNINNVFIVSSKSRSLRAQAHASE